MLQMGSALLKLRSLALSAAIIAVALAMLPLPAVASTSEGAEKLPLNWVVKQLARKGGEILVEIGFAGGAYRATVRHDDGRLSQLVIDPVNGEVRPTDQGDILRNSIDLGVLDGIRGALSGDLPKDALPAFKIIGDLMDSGNYRDLHSLRVEGGLYRVIMIAADGAEVQMKIDPVTGALARQGA